MRNHWASFVAWLGLVSVLAFMAPSAKADAYRYPQETPVLQVTLPDGWSINEQNGPAKLLLCSPPQDSTYIISVMTLPTVGDKADLKEILTRIVRAGAQGSEMTEITVSNVTEGPVGRGSRTFTKITASGKHNDESSAFTYYAFTLPGTGRYYAVGTAGLQAMIDAHQADFEAVAQSIVPVR